MKDSALKINAGLARTLIERGLAQEIDGYLVPSISGGDPAADSPFPLVPEDLSGLSIDELDALEASVADAIDQVGAAPASFVSEARTSAELLALMTAAVEALEVIRAEADGRPDDEAEPEPEPELEPVPAAEPVEPAPVEPEPAPQPTDEELAAQAAALADRARETEPEPVAALEVVPAVEPIVASVVPARRPLPRPARSRAAKPPVEEKPVSLVAGAGAPDVPLGTPFEDTFAIAKAMVDRQRSFGEIPEGMSTKEIIARADWTDRYPEDRRLGRDETRNDALVAAVVDQKAITKELERRRTAAENGDPSLVASGGLCAPVTPYYDLMMVSTSDRPVRASLAAFNADRGGIRYATPPSLGSIVGGASVGAISAAQDAFPGSSAQKTCLVVPCPPFQETDVSAIYHCLQFGNLGARTFPERVAHFNNLVLAAQARFAESFLLTGIDAFSTQVTAGSLGLGASASLFSQWLVAANAMRNRHRMDPDAVLRLLVPEWVCDLIVSDVIRGQFQRFDTNEDKVTALLRSFYIEPTYYLDGANGRAQVFGTQAAGALLPFPATIVSYLFPEGAFLHLDGGTLELGLVRDSVLNKTNDFQIFGETFENVAFVGVESMAIASSTCDVGIVAGTHNSICPINYGLSS